jgi:Kef-type K+ transport system membrane component KefB
MVKKITIELIWLLSLFVLVIICLGFLIGFNNLTSNETYDVSVFDTYVVIKLFDLALYLFVLLGFATYLVKVIIKKISHEPSNIVLLLFSLYIVFTIWSINN